jgi:hypothetical protein
VPHIPPENLSTFIALYLAFSFLLRKAPSFHILSKDFLETELEALSDEEIFSFFPTYHLINLNWLHLRSDSVGRNWYASALSEKLPRTQHTPRPSAAWDATRTQPSSEN